VGVELGLSHLGSNVGKGCWKMGYRVTDILVHKRDKEQGPGGEYIMESNMNWYSSPIGMRWTDHVARWGRRELNSQFLVGKYEGKRPVGRP